MPSRHRPDRSAASADTRPALCRAPLTTSPLADRPGGPPHPRLVGDGADAPSAPARVRVDFVAQAAVPVAVLLDARTPTGEAVARAAPGPPVSTARMEPSPAAAAGGRRQRPSGGREGSSAAAAPSAAAHSTPQQNRAGRRQDRTGRSTVVVLGALPPVLLAIKPAIEVVAQAGGADARWRRPSTCRSSTAARAPPSRPEQLVAFHRNPCSRSAPSTHPLCRALIALRTLPSS